MLRILRRVERLEEDILPMPDEAPEIMTVQFVGADKKVVSTLEFQMGQACPRKRSWSLTPVRRHP